MIHILTSWLPDSSTVSTCECPRDTNDLHSIDEMDLVMGDGKPANSELSQIQSKVRQTCMLKT